MIALQYHEVRVKVKFSTPDKIFNHFSLTKPNLDKNISNPVLSTTDMPALRRLVRNLYMRGVYGNEMAQMVAVDGDLSLVNYVIDNVMYENKVTLTVDSTSKTITMKLAAVSGVIDTILANTEFKIPANLLADEERYGVNATTAVTTVANSREEWMASPPSLSYHGRPSPADMDETDPPARALPLFRVVDEDETYLFFGMEHAPAQGTVRVQKHSRFVNGQDFCDVLSLGKRKIKTFTRTRAFEDLLQAMRDHMGLSSADNLVEKIQGGTPSMQGTWMHPSLVWHVAAWISPVFAVAAMDWADAFYNAPAAAGQRGCMAALTHRLVAEVERQPVYQCEADVRDRVAARIQGQAEAPVGQTGMRADVVSHRYRMIVEVKEISRWTDAIGQLMVYGRYFDPGLSKVIVVFDKEGREVTEEQLDIIEFHLQGLNIMCCNESYFQRY
eukprot:jgi/Mesvir1/13754/Mv22695-RA.1